MIPISIVQWPDLFPKGGVSLTVKVTNALVDHFMTPLLGQKLCLDRLYYNPKKFVNQATVSSPIFRGSRIENGALMLKEAPRPTRVIPGRSFLVGSMNNFGHFVVNYLPRFVMAREIGVVADHYIVGAGGSYVEEFLVMAGVDPAQIVRVQGDDVALVEQMVVAPMLCCVDQSKKIIRMDDAYPSRMRAMYCDLSEAPSKILFISRRGAAWRRLLNEAEVFDALRPFGVEEIIPERYSVREQLALAGAAKIIIGAGGTGLSMTGFAAPSCHLIELIHQQCKSYGDWLDGLVGRSGISHHKIIGEMIIPTTGRRYLHDADFTIDPSSVYGKVKEILDEAKV